MISAIYSRLGVYALDSRFKYPAGGSPLEKLPSELLEKIMSSVTIPSNISVRTISMPKNPNSKPVKESLNLLSVLLTSKRLYNAAIPVIYRNPHLTSPTTFETFVERIIQTPNLGRFIRHLNLTQLAPTRNVTGPWSKTSNPLFELLCRTPLLKSLHIDQYLGTEIEESILRLLLCDLKHLETLSFNSCNSPNFERSFGHFFAAGEVERFTSIVTLSFRNCDSMSRNTFQSLLPLMPALTSLNVSNTQITVDALNSIPSCARLQHLDISHSASLSGKELANFLTSHPAISTSLRSLNMAETPEERILDDEDLATIIASLPSTIQSLNLHGTNLTSSHVSYLQKRTSELEFLSVGSHLQMKDIETLLISTNFDFNPEELQSSAVFTDDSTKTEHRSVLSTMEKAIIVCKLRRRLNSVNLRHRPGFANHNSKLRYLDISSMSIPEQGKIQSSVLLSGCLADLQVIEISGLVVRWNEMLGDVCRSVGWKLKTVGRRCWLERV